METKMIGIKATYKGMILAFTGGIFDTTAKVARGHCALYESMEYAKLAISGIKIPKKAIIEFVEL